MDKKEKKTMPTMKFHLILRIIIGLYLMYLAWDMRDTVFKYEGNMQKIFLGALVLFMAVGCGIIVSSILRLKRGEFEETEGLLGIFPLPEGAEEALREQEARAAAEEAAEEERRLQEELESEKREA